MKLNLGGMGKKARIEMLPLIDIVFLLLVVFIYAMLSMAVHRGMAVDLPIAGSAEIDQQNFLSVTLRSSGPDQPAAIFIGKEKVSLETLTDKLLAQAKGNMDEEILLFADKSVRYQEVFQVLDTLRTVGLHRISLQSGRQKEP